MALRVGHWKRVILWDAVLFPGMPQNAIVSVDSRLAGWENAPFFHPSWLLTPFGVVCTPIPLNPCLGRNPMPSFRLHFLKGCLCLAGALLGLSCGGGGGAGGSVTESLPEPPTETVKLVFIHHSTGEAWLGDGSGGLGLALRDNNYFVSDTNYGWGPDDEDAGAGTIGDHTDIPNWYAWFTGPHRSTYTAALYAEDLQHCAYTRLTTDPGGDNTVVLFKSCFPNSDLAGTPTDPPATSADHTSSLTVANAKRIYLDLLTYFGAHPEKLFVVITAPPLASGVTDASKAANARAFNNWLVDDWLTGYPHANVAVFDYFTVLTSNGGSPSINDLGSASGNHHRYRGGVLEHITAQGSDFAAYATDPASDSHPTAAGHRKATAEFVPVLNGFYQTWKATVP